MLCLWFCIKCLLIQRWPICQRICLAGLEVATVEVAKTFDSDITSVSSLIVTFIASRSLVVNFFSSTTWSQRHQQSYHRGYKVCATGLQCFMAIIYWRLSKYAKQKKSPLVSENLKRIWKSKVQVLGFCIPMNSIFAFNIRQQRNLWWIAWTCPVCIDHRGYTCSSRDDMDSFWFRCSRMLECKTSLVLGSICAAPESILNLFVSK